MMHWKTLAAASIAAVGAAAVATPVSSAPSGLQTLEFTAASAEQPKVQLIDHRRRHYRYRRFRDDDDFDIKFGFFPFVGFGHPYRYSYYDYDYDDSYVHCHGRKFWRKGRLRCSGRWHRHFY